MMPAYIRPAAELDRENARNNELVWILRLFARFGGITFQIHRLPENRPRVVNEQYIVQVLAFLPEFVLEYAHQSATD